MIQLWRELSLINRGARRIMLWSHTALAAGSALLFALLLLANAGVDYAEERFVGALPEQELRITARKTQMGVLRLNEPGARASMSPEDLEAMRALPRVRQAFPLVYGSMPCYVRVNFLGKTFTSEMVVQGIDPAWIADDVDPADFQWKPGDELPVALNAQLLTIYNSGYAKSQGLPEISEEALTGISWTFSYGPNARAHAGPDAVTVKARVVALSGKVALGAAIPREALDYFHRMLDKPPAEVTEAVLSLQQDADTQPARQGVEALGFVIEEPGPLAKTVRRLRQLVSLAGISLLIGLCLFAFSFLNQTLKMLFLVKRRDYAICMAMGMSRARLRWILMVELFGLIGLDLAIGFFCGWLTAVLANHLYLSQLLIELAGSPLTIALSTKTMAVMAAAALAAGAVTLTPRLWRLTGRPAGELLSHDP